MEESTNIKEEVLSTVTLPLAELLKKLQRNLGDTKYVYSESLDYVQAVKKYRNDNNMNGTSDNPFPLFCFNRSVLRYAESFGGIGRRSTNFRTIYNIENDDLAPYLSASVIQGEFDVNFLYIAKDIQDIERFEVAYLGHRGLADGQKLSAFIPELNETMDFHLDFKDGLDDKTIVVDDNYYKAITGKFLIRGYFLVFKGRVSLIKSINATIKDFNEVVLSTINIEA
jgi:hypothetical protein